MELFFASNCRQMFPYGATHWQYEHRRASLGSPPLHAMRDVNFLLRTFYCRRFFASPFPPTEPWCLRLRGGVGQCAKKQERCLGFLNLAEGQTTSPAGASSAAAEAEPKVAEKKMAPTRWIVQCFLVSSS